MPPQKYPVVCVFGLISSDDKLKFQDSVSIHFFNTDNNLTRVLRQYKPQVIISIGPSWQDFPNLVQAPYDIRKRWVHYESFNQVTLSAMENCFMSACLTHGRTDHSLQLGKPPDNPLMSVVTTSYNSGDKIKRAINSLLRQTYSNWEWLIIDDNHQPDLTLDQLAQQDHRIRVYRSTGNSGVIGEVKYDISMLARGHYIIELDHDDELLPHALDHLRRAFAQHPQAGFAYSDFIEPQEDDYSPALYGDGWAMGWGSYRVGWCTNAQGDTFRAYIAQSAPITPKTMTNIVGVPNHVRVWNAQLYRHLAGHNFHLPVADDYELLIRTVMSTTCIRIRDLCYIQYRNSAKNGGNTTFNWNSLIQRCQSLVYRYYGQKLRDYFQQELKVDSRALEQDLVNATPIWTRGWNFFPSTVARQIDWSPVDDDCISIVIPTYNRPQLLQRAIDSVLAQTYTNWELYIVGDKCQHLESVMDKYQDHRIFWWNLGTNYNDLGTTPRNYALYTMVRSPLVAYLDDDNYWEPHHLQHLKQALDDYPQAEWAFSSFIMESPEGPEGPEGSETIICTKPQLYRVDTSALLHKYQLLTQYGFWSKGYGHDWELVSRWLDRPWVATQKPTVHYRVHGQVDVKHLATYYDKDPLDTTLVTDTQGRTTKVKTSPSPSTSDAT